MIDFEKLREKLENMTQEYKDRYFPENNLPKGWISIEEHLPKYLAFDIATGYTAYRVKYGDGAESITYVTDHNLWYYQAKEEGITHWFNG